MLYHILYPLAQDYAVLNVFKYLTFRCAGAVLTSLILSFILGPAFIRWLKRKQKSGQPIRADGPESHLITKVGTPTMGGVLIISTMTISALLWSDLSNRYVWVVLFVAVGYGVLGALDDYIKLAKKSSDGVSARVKFSLQLFIALVAVFWILKIVPDANSHSVSIPFLKNVMLNLGWMFIPWAMLVIVGSSNAVNLTDGLDGLAIVPAMIVAACFCLIAYLVGNIVFANYLQIHPIAGSGELSIICASLVGASLGFLWYNAPPAMVFMGDTGSLSIGGMLGSISIITKHELVLFIMGGLFVMETISVILQVGYFKMTGKRIFLMAPIHHHFEKKGWPEPTIVIRFWIISVILGLIGLATLKLR